MNPRAYWRFFQAAVVLAGLIPLAAYYLLVGRASALSTEEAFRLLNQPAPPAGVLGPSGTLGLPLLVDVREAAEFNSRRLEGSVHWPLSAIRTIESSGQVPPAFRDRPLALICDYGLRSAVAARHLAGLSPNPVWSVSGGLQEWLGLKVNAESGVFSRLVYENGAVVGLPFRPMPRLDQWLVVVTSFGLKPLYMTLSLAWMLVLWRNRRPDGRLLFWSMALFLVGEAFCAVNYLMFHDDSYVTEYLHGLGMVYAFGLAAGAFLETMDERFMHVSDRGRRCVALPLCGDCAKFHPVPCRLRRIGLFAIPATALLAVLPLTAPTVFTSYLAMILGSPNHYRHPGLVQTFELGFAPLFALGFFSVSFLTLWSDQTHDFRRPKAWYAAGLGFLGFSLFRTVLFGVFDQDLGLATNWEEWTETLFILGVGWILWVFRIGPFGRKKSTAAPPSA